MITVPAGCTASPEVLIAIPENLSGLIPRSVFWNVRRTDSTSVVKRLCVGTVCDYLVQHEMLHLYGTKATGPSDWFLTLSPVEVHRMRPFHKKPDSLLDRTRFENRADGPRVSTPERAVLELLRATGKCQALHQSHELVESANRIRADVLSELLRK
jgi:hypothetical protein